MSLAQTIVGILGNMTSVGLFLSPLPTFWYVYKTKSTEQYSAIPYVCTLLQCGLWLLYGSPMVHGAILIMTINGFGLVVEAVYVVVFLWFAKDRKTRLEATGMLALALIAGALVTSITLLIVPDSNSTPNKREMIVGILCVVMNTVMYASPLSVMWLVIKTKSTKYMPFFLSLSCFLNAILWTLFAVISTLDIYVLIPNATGLVLSCLQLGIYACFCDTKCVDVDGVAISPEKKGAMNSGKAMELPKMSAPAPVKLVGHPNDPVMSVAV